MIKYSIEDEVHAEWQGDFSTREEALAELKRREKIPWNEEPNKCPCIGWETCERIYVIQKYDTSYSPYKLLHEESLLTISSEYVQWTIGSNDSKT